MVTTRIFAIRIALLALAAGAVGLAFVMAAGRAEVHRKLPSLRADAYACAMHPEVRAEAPGVCPICGMVLARVGSSGPTKRDVSNTAEGAVFSIPARTVAQGTHIIRAVERKTIPRTFRFWAEALAPRSLIVDVSRDALSCVPRADAALDFHPSAAHATSVIVRISAEEEAPDQRTSTTPAPREGFVRRWLRVPADTAALAVGTVGWLDLPACSPSVAMVPGVAILSGPTGPYVLVVGPNGRTFARHRVELGQPWPPYEILTAGVAVGERVVTLGAALFDAEADLSSPPGEAP